MDKLMLFFCILLSTQIFSESLVIEKKFFPPKSTDIYRYVPFDVPDDVVEIKVSYSYDRKKHTVDIGIFDSNGIGKKGFRGWSGGSKSEFIIAEHNATAAYLPGPIYSGTWQVILGLYQVEPSGVDIKIEVEFRTSSANSFAGPRFLWNADQVLESNTRWYKGDLHMHTNHSDGKQTIEDLVAYAKENQLDFLAMTEHNTCSHHFEIPTYANNEVLLILGEEVTTTQGHANVWGLPQGYWIDFRINRNNSINDIVRDAHSVGALFSINHPFGPCGGCYWNHSDLEDYDSIEIWNGYWDPTDYLALQMWDRLLQQGKRIPIVGSSDSHKKQDPIGKPTTHVYASNLSQKAILTAIKNGRAYITKDISPTAIEFSAYLENTNDSAMMGDILNVRKQQEVLFAIAISGCKQGKVNVICNGRKIISKNISQLKNGMLEFSHIIVKDSYFRLEVEDDYDMIAVTNPIYVDMK
ncbi:CehA/McbA family metallohydrolase [Candidatus Uabimicrobium amorphum]|uniref:Phosphoesterase n=1 Tax=Uabimicrobium amorphum TaxID=2596890 RepID=A0A5S9IT60_UABAM|nr:CehA/McbA family metallohydrolase [Candidatus Uabimicrobium amorphum]BBM87166.1 phosphoesterase [Candidatus Uabimicrobium amorphum]